MSVGGTSRKEKTSPVDEPDGAKVSLENTGSRWNRSQGSSVPSKLRLSLGVEALCVSRRGSPGVHNPLSAGRGGPRLAPRTRDGECALVDADSLR